MRYIGQAQLGPNDVASVKLFVANRNGAEAINVLWRDIMVRADRVTGLGTIVRTVLGDVVYADPTSIEEKDILVLGGQPKAPPQPAAKPGDPKAVRPRLRKTSRSPHRLGPRRLPLRHPRPRHPQSRRSSPGKSRRRCPWPRGGSSSR